MLPTTLAGLISVFLIFMLLPLLSLMPIYRKYGVRMPNKVAAIWWLLTLIYYVILFNAGPAILNHYWPLQVSKETVCEVKTTYSRQGLF